MPKKSGNNLVSLIDDEIRKLQDQIRALEKVKADYARIVGGGGGSTAASFSVTPAATGNGRSRKRGPMSPEARAKLAEAARERWAKAKAMGVANLKAAAKKQKGRKKKPAAA